MVFTWFLHACKISIFPVDYDVIVNKIGIINRFYDINSPEHHQIILEEKLNGTKLI